MNFLQLAQKTRALSGTQGTGPVSVVSADGYEAALVSFVADAWIDIQNHKEDWDFMHGRVTFDTVASQAEYTIAEIFLADPTLHKRWCKQAATIEDGTKEILSYRDPEYIFYTYLNDTSAGKPTEYTFKREDNSIILRVIPDDAYNIDLHYYRSPQILTLNTDIPILNASYHNLIVYKALIKMAVFIASPELYQHYTIEADKMMGQLMRSEVPAKMMKRPVRFAI